MDIGAGNSFIVLVILAIVSMRRGHKQVFAEAKQ